MDLSRAPSSSAAISRSPPESAIGDDRKRAIVSASTGACAPMLISGHVMQPFQQTRRQLRRSSRSETVVAWRTDSCSCSNEEMNAR